jgi:hypothetical protein
MFVTTGRRPQQSPTNPVAPLGCNGRVVLSEAGPAMSMWTQGVSLANVLRNRPDLSRYDELVPAPMTCDPGEPPIPDEESDETR